MGGTGFGLSQEGVWRIDQREPAFPLCFELSPVDTCVGARLLRRPLSSPATPWAGNVGPQGLGLIQGPAWPPPDVPLLRVLCRDFSPAQMPDVDSDFPVGDLSHIIKMQYCNN